MALLDVIESSPSAPKHNGTDDHDTQTNNRADAKDDNGGIGIREFFDLLAADEGEGGQEVGEGHCVMC